MPFSGPSSYLPTMDEYIAHWTDVNAALGIDPLLLPGGYSLANLTTHRASMSTAITELINEINTLETKRMDRDTAKGNLREKMSQFNNYVRGVLGNSSYVNDLPELVPFAASPGRWITAMRDTKDIWNDIHASPPAGFTPPLTLTGGYVVATFTTDTAALETIFQAITTAENDVSRELEERDALYLEVRGHLAFYREAVMGRFASNHPLVLSIPRLDPLPGHTPDPVVLSGVWNGGTNQADLSWTASGDPDLANYQVRRCAPPYNSNIEQVVATVPAGTLTHSTTAGLSGSGAQMAFKVYVVLTTGNEKGSNAVTVVRP